MKKSAEDLRKTLGIALIENLGAVTFQRLLETFGSVEAVFAANLKDFEKIPLRGRIVDWQELVNGEALQKADVEIKKAKESGVRLLPFGDEDYPALLSAIYDPPIVLYVKGRLPDPAVPRVAIVGSRHATKEGLKTSHEIARELAAHGVIVVSGMASGVDTASHEGALLSGTDTLAVLGGGIGKIYPAHNISLAEKIVKQGALVSEYPIDMLPKPEYFPIRNRIISGLSQVVLVVEGAQKSGALITADTALEQGRDVCAVPGSIYMEQTAGTNALIKQGAKCVTSAQDILEILNIKSTVASSKLLTPRPVLNAFEQHILDCCEEGEAIHIDDLIEKSERPAHEVASALSILEIKKTVAQLPGMFYKKV